MASLSLVSETLASVATDATKLRDATPADAADLAMALAREIARKMRALVETSDPDDSDPFALATRGRDEEMRQKRVLLAGLNGLKAAHAKYTAVYEAWQTACAELSEATEAACIAVNVNQAEIAKSLGIAVKAPNSDAMSDLARERKERAQKEREIAETIAAEKNAAKEKMIAARKERDAAIEAAREARKALNATK